MVKFEDQESRLRTPEKDADLFHETCNNLRKLFSQINDFKKQQSDKAVSIITHIYITKLIVILKKCFCRQNRK